MRIVALSATVLALVVFPAGEVRGAKFMGLGDLPGRRFWSVPFAVSADGSTIVGVGVSAESGSNGEAFRWTAETGMVRLGDFRGSDVSGDGSVVVGTGFDERAEFRWTAESGIVRLANLDGTFDPVALSKVAAISADGTTIVGSWTDPADEDHDRLPFYWTDDTGMVRLHTDEMLAIVFGTVFALNPGGLRSIAGLAR